MTIQELINILERFDPTQDVFVALFKNDGTSEIFEIEEIVDNPIFGLKRETHAVFYRDDASFVAAIGKRKEEDGPAGASAQKVTVLNSASLGTVQKVHFCSTFGNPRFCWKKAIAKGHRKSHRRLPPDRIRSQNGLIPTSMSPAAK